MVKFDLNPSLSLGKQVSISHPEGWAKGGSYNTPKQGVRPMKAEAIVTDGGSVGEWAKGGGTTSIGGAAVKAAKPV